MLYDTVLPGVETVDPHLCPDCHAGFKGPAPDRDALNQALTGPAEQLRAFLGKYRAKVKHPLPNCLLTDVRTALIANCKDAEEALGWERQVRTKLGEPALPDRPVDTPD